MSYLIRCSTLFDITATGVRNRTCPADAEPDKWLLARNQQCNFDTVIQSISIRSLPEVVSVPVVLSNQKHSFGTIYKPRLKFWQFDFTVSDITVWKLDSDDLYYLYSDCQDVPMIVCGTEIKNISRSLSTQSSERNIYFEVMRYES